jgi:hypothetical protein
MLDRLRVPACGTPTSALLMLAVVLLTAGCTSNADGNAGGTVESYLHDLGNGNYPAACQLLTTELASQLGDCPGALRKHHGDLPVGEFTELRLVSVSHVVRKTGSTALVYPQDIKVRTTVTVKVNGTPAPRSSASRSIAANHAMDGRALELTKVGNAWRISGGGV